LGGFWLGDARDCAAVVPARVWPGSEKLRVLYLPSAGFCIFLAIAVDGLGGRFRYLVAALILSFNVVALHHNLDLWQYASAKVKDACFVAQADGTGSITVWGLSDTHPGCSVIRQTGSESVPR